MAEHTLIRTLKNLRGNARGAVYTEPLWGIPYNLYAPYVSVYMLALGMTDARIGLLTSISTAFQVFWTLMSGPITDKLGRKRTTLIFDILSWSVPTLIWAVARDFRYFLAAAIVNAVLRVTQNSWNLVLIEDADPKQLVDIYSWVYISGLLAAFVAPLTGLLIGHYGMVRSMRGLYLLAFVMMTVKFLVMNVMVTETQQGVVRMRETANQGLFSLLREYPAVLRQIVHSRATLYIVGLMLILSIGLMVRGTFWSILVSQEIRIPDERLSLFAFARSMTMLVFFFVAMPRLQRMAYLSGMGELLLMILGFAGLAASQVILVNVPVGNTWLLLLATILEGASIPLTSTMLDKRTAVTVDPKERARIMALLNVVVLLGTTPFGWLAGQLSAVDRRLPFYVTIGLFALGGVVAYLAHRTSPEVPAAAVEGAVEGA